MLLLLFIRDQTLRVAFAAFNTQKKIMYYTVYNFFSQKFCTKYAAFVDVLYVFVHLFISSQLHGCCQRHGNKPLCAGNR